MAFRSVFILTLALFAMETAAEAEDDMLHMFLEMDMDKDGFLSLKEYSGFSDEDDHGMSPEELAHAKTEMQEHFDKADADKDSRLSMEELAKESGADGPMPEEDAMPAMETDAEKDDTEEGMEDDAQTAQHLLKDLDRDNDGQLTLEELMGGSNDMDEAEKQWQKDYQEEFSKADKDMNGKLSMEELQDGMRVKQTNASGRRLTKGTHKFMTDSMRTSDPKLLQLVAWVMCTLLLHMKGAPSRLVSR